MRRADDAGTPGRTRRFPSLTREAVKVLPQSVDNAHMIDTHLDWPEMARYGIAAALFLLLFARLLMRG